MIRSLSFRAALYATLTVSLLTILQAWILTPGDRVMAWLVILLPIPACGGMTYLLTSVISKARSDAMIRDFRALRSGDLEQHHPTVVDLEFHAARDYFVEVARELREAERVLARRDAERRRLFSDVVHEIGTPVSSLLGLSGALVDPLVATTSAQRERVALAASQESERLARFVEDLREIAILDDPVLTLSKVEVDIAKLATDVVSRFREEHEKLDLEIEVTTASPTLNGDPFRLEQAIVNLLTNAIRHAVAKPILVTVTTRSITVEDGGEGVPENDLPLLGQRLRRMDPSRTRRTGGTGLGLSIVTAIVEKHEGSVRYRRSKLGGLCVELRF